MIVCGVDIKANEAILALVKTSPEDTIHVPCTTKRLALNDDRDVQALLTLKSSIEAFAHNHKVKAFVIKTRLGKGKLAAGGITFKIEALFQLSMIPVEFISPQTLAKFAKTNLGGVPEGVFEYQKDAYRVGACYLSKA